VNDILNAQTGQSTARRCVFLLDQKSSCIRYSHYGSGVYSVSKITEYQKIFLGGGGGKGWPACKVDVLTTIREVTCLESVQSLTSHNPVGLHSPLQGQLGRHRHIQDHIEMDLKRDRMKEYGPGVGSNEP
jgi:hypothetical protein